LCARDLSAGTFRQVLQGTSALSGQEICVVCAGEQLGNPELLRLGPSCAHHGAENTVSLGGTGTELRDAKAPVELLIIDGTRRLVHRWKPLRETVKQAASMIAWLKTD
jgi:hypothetical protein